MIEKNQHKDLPSKVGAMVKNQLQKRGLHLPVNSVIIIIISQFIFYSKHWSLQAQEFAVLLVICHMH